MLKIYFLECHFYLISICFTYNVISEEINLPIVKKHQRIGEKK